MSGNKSNTTMRKKKARYTTRKMERKNKKRLETTAGELHLDIRNQGEMRVDSGPRGGEEGRRGTGPTPARHPHTNKEMAEEEGREGRREAGRVREKEGGKRTEKPGTVWGNPVQTKPKLQTIPSLFNVR